MTIQLPVSILQQAQHMDSTDILAPYKDLFHLPEGVIYLDGNSLGVLPKSTPDCIQQTVTEQWGRGLIRSWNDAGWIHAPTRIGDKLANILGANMGEVIITDTISINLYKTICYALSISDKKTILIEQGTFPSDMYIANGISQIHTDVRIKTIPSDAYNIEQYLTPDIAVAVLSDVNFKTARLLDMQAITAHAKKQGIRIIWDLAHSAGAVDIHLKNAGVEMAVGCTYKYLNGGPGSPAFIYVDKALQGKGTQPIMGWFSHNNMFAMSPDYTPAPDIRQFQTGTYSAITYHALESSLDMWQMVDMTALRQKSLRLTDWFYQCMKPIMDTYGITCVTPLNHTDRGSHMSFSIAQNGYEIVQALIKRGVIGDFRSPNIMRFGFTPLYVSFTDVAMAVQHFKMVMENQEYNNPEFKTQSTVT